MAQLAQLSGNLSLNELSANSQLTVSELHSELYGSGCYYIGYAGEPVYTCTGYDPHTNLCIDEKYIKQISEELHKAVSVEKENKINNEPEIPKWTGFIEI